MTRFHPLPKRFAITGERAKLHLGALPHAPTSSLVDSRPANKGPSLDRCWGRRMRTAELSVKPKAKAGKRSGQNEKVELGRRSARHAPGSPAPRVFPGPELDPPTARKAGKTKEREAQQSSTTRSILKIRKAVFSKIAFFLLAGELRLDPGNVLGSIDACTGPLARDSHGDRHSQ